MKIGILGASGAVGRQMIACLEQREIEVDELRLMGFASVGQKILFQGKEHTIVKPSFEGLDVVLGATSAQVAKEYVKAIKHAKALFIDNSSAFRHDETVPLVIPQLNAQDIAYHQGIIANPNCSTIIALMAINAISKLSEIVGVNAVTYQAVSGAGVQGIQELADETREYVKTKQISRHHTIFPFPILYNCIPQIGDISDDGYTSEEIKMEKEARKILHLPKLKVNCTCVRVPVMRSHCIALTVYANQELDLLAVEKALQASPGVVYLKDELPMPLVASDNDEVYVGRLRKDRLFPNGITLFVCGDQIRKGAATNAIEILECYTKL
ncbi:MAG: aspartate-semialdehyde dehydrogenase [Erysipelotrichaceae bacterium]|nr:aspartate-semialdehyde dehydrogenase [Erysipelotrichaceae bacterium]MDY5251474.1 aspartate-semialdehyde dehydrogenase [Erysipelotrichaceae bacterium]